MTIDSGTNNLEFAGNVDVITGTYSATKLKANIYLSNNNGVSNSFVEEYDLVSSSIKITDIRNLVAPYFDFSADGITQNMEDENLFYLNNHFVDLTIYLYNGSSLIRSVGSRFLFSDVPISGTPSSYNKFLSRAPLKVMVPRTGMSSVNFISNAGKFVVDVCWVVGSTSRVTRICNQTLTSQPNKRGTFWFSWDLVADAVYQAARSTYSGLTSVNPNSITYLKCSLQNSSGNALDECLFFRENHDRRGLMTFAFIGAMGQLEFVNMVGESERTPSMDGTFLTIDNEYKKVHTDFTLERKAYSGAIQSWQRDNLYDMANSRWVWLVNGRDLIPITITSIDFGELEPHLEPINIAVTYRVSDNYRQRSFSRDAHVEGNRIFTTDFNSVFA